MKKPDFKKLKGITLTEGPHESREEGFCAMEAYSYCLGMRKHTDQPKCVPKDIIDAMITANDAYWADDYTRTKRLRLRLQKLPQVKSTPERRLFAILGATARHIAQTMVLLNYSPGLAPKLRAALKKPQYDRLKTLCELLRLHGSLLHADDIYHKNVTWAQTSRLQVAIAKLRAVCLEMIDATSPWTVENTQSLRYDLQESLEFSMAARIPKRDVQISGFGDVSREASIKVLDASLST